MIRWVASTCCALVLASALVGRAGATVYPSVTDVDFQTSGRERAPTIGDWYTTLTSASTDRIHRFFIEVTPSQLASGGGTVVVTIVDAESNTPNSAGQPADEVSSSPDPTRFQLRDRTGTVVLQSATFPSGSPNGSTAVFTITSVGVYQITSETGAYPISGSSTTDLNNDDNSFRIDVPGAGGAIGGLVGSLQGTFQHSSSSRITYQTYFLVGPGSTSLALRNFDIDTCSGCTVTYTRPSGSGIAGTVSGNGVWNNGGNLNSGQDDVVGLSTVGPGVNDAGVWGLRVFDWNSNNQLILEAQDGSSGANIAIYDEPPVRAGNFAMSPPTTLSTDPGVPVDHAFTVTNDFSTTDIINLSTTGTSANWTVQLLTSGGAPLTDTDGDGAVDTGILAAGGSVGLLLRVTPNPGAVGPDVTQIEGVSYMDTKVDPANNVLRTLDKTTRLRPSIGKAFDPATIGPSGVSTITFTLTNPNKAPALTGAQFTDPYPAGLLNTTPLVVGGTCTGVTHTATAGGGSFDLTSADIPALGSCTITVDVTSSVAGIYDNTTSGVSTAETGGPGVPSNTATLIVNPPLTVAKSSRTQSDPVNGTTNPKSIPGAFVDYSVTVSNTGQAAIDSNTVVITDAIPVWTDLFVNDVGGPGSGPVAFVDGVPPSGLTYTFVSLGSTTDDVEFSNNGGATYSYVPVPDGSGVDSSVTHLRIRPKGEVTGRRRFLFRFRVQVE